MRVLCIGDVVGKPGRRAVRALVPTLRQQHELDLVIVNAENAAGGVGLTAETARELLTHGADVLTGGNHLWKYKDLIALLQREERILRPLNYPEGTPGRGHVVVETPAGHRVAVLNLQGRVFMEPVPCPFRAARDAVQELRRETPIILVDFHAEATSEKRALGWHLDGSVSALYGTHTHVATADEEILPGGTGYITDIGMTGPHRSVIGMQAEEMIQRFMTLRPAPFVVATEDVRLCGVIFEIDPASGNARSVERVREPWRP